MSCFYHEIQDLLRPLKCKIPSFLDNETLCRYRYITNDMLDITALELHTSNLLCIVSKF